MIDQKQIDAAREALIAFKSVATFERFHKYTALRMFIDAVEAAMKAEPVSYMTEAQIDDYIEDYEMRGEDADGRDACHTPTADERALIKDAIMGLPARLLCDASPLTAKEE